MFYFFTMIVAQLFQMKKISQSEPQIHKPKCEWKDGIHQFQGTHHNYYFKV